MLDTRDGINFNDVALYNWLTLNSLRIKEDNLKLREMRKQEVIVDEEGPDFDYFEEAIVVDEKEMNNRYA